MTNALSTHYAEALADAVFAPNADLEPEEAVRQLRKAAELFASSQELHRVLMSPAVPRHRKIQIIGKLVDEFKFHRLIRNFLMVIVEHRRSSDFQGLILSFEAAVDQRQGYVRVEILSAKELTDAQNQELLHALGTVAGKYIRPVYKVDPRLLGGVIARLGSKQFDGSLIGRLEAMGRQLSAAS
jgi:F-type H+-transporting ATPase subunit delta